MIEYFPELKSSGGRLNVELDTARLKQANLTSKNNISNFVKKDRF